MHSAAALHQYHRVRQSVDHALESVVTPVREE
jgi:hypothetical protein